MNFNWGKGITLVIIAFMAFILMMVFKATTTNADLHAQDYYNQELDYQTKINAIQQTKSLKDKLTIKQNKDQIEIEFPSDFEGKAFTGTIHFFKPNNASLDKLIAIKANENAQTLSKEQFIKGHYQVKITLISDGTNYYFEQPIELN